MCVRLPILERMEVDEDVGKSTSYSLSCPLTSIMDNNYLVSYDDNHANTSALSLSLTLGTHTDASSSRTTSLRLFGQQRRGKVLRVVKKLPMRAATPTVAPGGSGNGESEGPEGGEAKGIFFFPLVSELTIVTFLLFF
jgi:hypothetical protein